MKADMVCPEQTPLAKVILESHSRNYQRSPGLVVPKPMNKGSSIGTSTVEFTLCFEDPFISKNRFVSHPTFVLGFSLDDESSTK
jgi:hypothetical protein